MIHAVLALTLLATLACIVLVAWIVARDRALRGMRVSDGEIRREDITPSLPNDWMRQFHER
jgi:hypothetical protein